MRKRALVLPEPPGDRAGVMGQGKPLRVFVLGDSSAAGVGTDHQSKALSGQLLDRLARHYEVEWMLDAATGRTTRQMVKRLSKIPARQFDIAVTALGVNDITRRASRENWLEDTEQMHDLLQSKFGVKHIYVSGIPRIGDFPLLPPMMRWMLGKQGQRYDAGLAEMIASRPGCYHVPADLELHGLMSEDGFHPGPQVYSEWAQKIYVRILLNDPPENSPALMRVET
ncbi:MAG: SGNH/GDSL hydrolase family protein [Pseudomonadota bacterium]